MTSEPGLRDIAELYQVGREKQAVKQDYTVDRISYEDGLAGSYLTDLPTFEGKNVVELLDELTKKKRVAMLDIGCGKGNFLMEMKKTFGRKIECDGITTHKYHSELKTRWAGINIKVEDVQNLFRRKRYDVVIAEHSLQYPQNPLVALKRIYDSLKDGGVALLYPFNPRFSSAEEQKQFVEYMKNEYGFIFSRGGEDTQLAFQKTKNKLTMPVRISKIIDAGSEWIKVPQMEYRFVGSSSSEDEKSTTDLNEMMPFAS